MQIDELPHPSVGDSGVIMPTNCYTIDDLPKFSPWPARLLGLDHWEPKRKTAEEVLREYGNDKWGALLEQVRRSENPVTLEQADEWASQASSRLLCSFEDRLELLTAHEAHCRYLALLEAILKPFLPASALVELGAGYGSQILALSKHKTFEDMPCMAGEYTDSGIELIRALALAEKVGITVGHCDFNMAPVASLKIPRGAIIFTSMATHYVPKLSHGFIESMSVYHPRAVVHLEPCYEHCEGQTLLGLMRRRYIEINDYNTNLITLLHESQAQGKIQILEERPQVMGHNALLPVSVVVWKPQY